MKTAQDVFDEVAEHLFTQGKQALIEDGNTCAYRAPDGSKCAVGALIPDDKYSPELEGCLADNELILALLPEEYQQHIEPLADMQRFHDHTMVSQDDHFGNAVWWWGSHAAFMSKLAALAQRHDLSMAKFEGRTFVPFAERVANVDFATVETRVLASVGAADVQ